jgi:hypothetical protein
MLAPRAYGDIDADALVMMALLDRSRPRMDVVARDERAVVGAFAHVLLTGFFAPT